MDASQAAVVDTYLVNRLLATVFNSTFTGKLSRMFILVKN